MESSPEKEVFSEEETARGGWDSKPRTTQGTCQPTMPRECNIDWGDCVKPKMWGLYSRAAQRWEAVQGTEPDPGKDGFASLCGLPVVLWPTGILNQGDLMVPEWEGAFIPIKKKF